MAQIRSVKLKAVPGIKHTRNIKISFLNDWVPEIILFQDIAQAHTELCIVAGACIHKPNHFIEMWTFHIGATLHSTTNCKT